MIISFKWLLKRFLFLFQSDDENKTKNCNSSFVSTDDVPVCLLAPHFATPELPKTISYNRIILSSFEALSNNQKFVLQASSILGEAFPRSILIYIMNLKNREKNQMDIAEAIQGLFELGILCCAKYQISERKQLILKRSCVDISNKCDCLDSSISEFYEPIPKYSFCQLLRFSSCQYKEFVRKLIPPDTAKEFHHRALKYLHRETRKCNTCGNGLMDFGDMNSQKLVGFKSQLDETFILTPRKFITEQAHTTDEMKKNLGKNTENKLIEFPLFSNYNFSQCECEIIMCSVYKQMVEHFKGLELYPAMLECIIKYAEMGLILKNYEKVVSLLQFGLKTLRSTAITSTILNLHYYQSEMFALEGKALLGLNSKEEALSSFCKAMDILGEPFPSGNITTYIKLYALRIRKNSNLYNCITFSKKNGRRETDACKTIAKTLSGIFKILKSEKKWKKAELSAVWSLTNSLEQTVDLPQILECVTNMMKIAIHQKNHALYKSLENYGLQICKKPNHPQRKDLFGVFLLYRISFFWRFNHSKMNQAIDIGKIIVRMSIDLNSIEYVLSSIPYIIMGFVIQKKVSEAWSLVSKMEYHSADSRQFKGKLWFFISNLILQMETGYSLVNFSECQMYYKDNVKEIHQHITEKQKLTILIWVWYVRNEQWQESFDLFKEIIEYVSSELLNAEKMAIYAMYLFEGVLLYLVQRSRDRNMLIEYNLENEVMQVSKKIESLNVPTICLPRFTHLKAYHELYKNDERMNAVYLDKAIAVSHETGNLLEAGWIAHSKRGWFNNLPDF
ncbi:hypothetical protein HHI36_002459 [Cryptolaemus montrouzieri]|uniref:Uncharacterized protein n=1 Tax=Cryptolaemus montrouzieri TaxID=559131 RepID=A0ABD2PAH4_9CUCU